MASVTRNNLLRWGVIFLFIWPVSGHAKISTTKHNFYPQNKERNCTLCHVPHDDKPLPVLWMPGNESAAGNKIPFFTLPKTEEILCLSCHDGVLASDMSVVLRPDMEISWEPDTLGIDRYNSGIKLLSDSCERHYNLLANYQPQLSGQRLKCSICHDIHCLNDSCTNGLITGKIYLRYEFCRKCHQAK